jgi:hypothetical protein
MNTILPLDESFASVIRKALEPIPSIKVLSVQYSSNLTPTITVNVSFTPRENWSNGIYQNSAHRTFLLFSDGELKSVTGYNLGKFRACHVKSAEEAAAKLVKWANEKALEV